MSKSRWSCLSIVGQTDHFLVFEEQVLNDALVLSRAVLLVLQAKVQGNLQLLLFGQELEFVELLLVLLDQVLLEVGQEELLALVQVHRGEQIQHSHALYNVGDVELVLELANTCLVHSILILLFLVSFLAAECIVAHTLQETSEGNGERNSVLQALQDALVLVLFLGIR